MCLRYVMKFASTFKLYLAYIVRLSSRCKFCLQPSVRLSVRMFLSIVTSDLKMIRRNLIRYYPPDGLKVALQEVTSSTETVSFNTRFLEDATCALNNEDINLLNFSSHSSPLLLLTGSK
jgi:hypothetical protein